MIKASVKSISIYKPRSTNTQDNVAEGGVSPNKNVNLSVKNLKNKLANLVCRDNTTRDSLKCNSPYNYQKIQDTGRRDWNPIPTQMQMQMQIQMLMQMQMCGTWGQVLMYEISLEMWKI